MSYYQPQYRPIGVASNASRIAVAAGPATGSGSGKKILIGLLVLLVLTIIGVSIGLAVWYFWPSSETEEEKKARLAKEEAKKKCINGTFQEKEGTCFCDSNHEGTHCETKKDTSNLAKFTSKSGYAITGKNYKVFPNFTPEKCADECIKAGDNCKSFDFNVSNPKYPINDCALGLVGIGEVANPGWDFYTPKKT